MLLKPMRYLFSWIALLWLLARIAAAQIPATLPVAELLRAGPMNGYATQREVVVWLQTWAPAQVQLLYRQEDQPEDSARITPPYFTTPETDYTVHIPIGYLEPGQRYLYNVILNDTLLRLPYQPHFQTQPLWQWRTDPPTFTVAAVSCFYVNDPPYDRPGQPYGGDFELLTQLVQYQPDLMLWLGDNTYLREPDFGSPAMMSYRYAHTRSHPLLQALLATTHHYAIWDDHDYGPNDADRSYVFKGAALRLFQQYWANPTYGLPGVPGVFTQFSWGDVDFFLLDDRFYRSPNDAPEDTSKTMWGKAQLEWLIDALTSSRAPFKIVANGNQILNRYTRFESVAARFPQDYERLIGEIVRRRISGVVFLTGDRHHTELMRYQPEGFYPLYEITTSPLTAGPSTIQEENPLRLEGTLLQERNAVLLTFSGPRTDRVLTLRAIDARGTVRWTYTLRARELRPPER